MIKINYLKRCIFPNISIIARNFRLPDRFSKLNDSDLFNAKYARQLVRINIPKRTQGSQRGLFHGKRPITGYVKTFSEKRTKVRRRINVFRKSFYSDILQRKFEINVSSKALRCIRKYGSFDNYILLTKKNKMDSLFGEYIREIMLRRLNNPEKYKHLNNANILGSIRTPKNSKNHFKFSLNNNFWHPPEIRFGDLTDTRVKTMNDLTKEELKYYQDYIDKVNNNEDVDEVTEAELKERDEIIRGKQALQNDLIEIKKYVDKKKHQKYKHLYLNQVKEARDEINEQLHN